MEGWPLGYKGTVHLDQVVSASIRMGRVVLNCETEWEERFPAKESTYPCDFTVDIEQSLLMLGWDEFSILSLLVVVGLSIVLCS